MFYFEAHKAKLIRTSTELLTSGMTKTVSCHFTFTSDWNGYAKTVIFTAGAVSKAMTLDANSECVIPWECLVTPNQVLIVGVYGALDSDADGTSDTVLPTIYAKVGMVLAGADPSADPSATPTASLLDQITTIVNGVRTDADNGKFDGATFTPSVTSGGTISWTNDKGKTNPDPVTLTNLDKNYVHIQATASALWDITHNMAKRPSVSVVDSAGTMVEGDVMYVSDNELTISFQGAFSGKAYLN